jgi:hypothetical protein
VGVPAVEGGYFRVERETPAEARLLHKKSEAFEEMILDSVICRVKNKYLGESVPAKNFVTPVTPGFQGPGKNRPGICGNRAVPPL